jgi:hypothetical protein
VAVERIDYHAGSVKGALGTGVGTAASPHASLYASIPNDGVVLGSLMRSGFTALTVSPATARSMIC